jgi:S1-C subfamily serine protease
MQSSARAGVVLIEQAGRVVALGTLLNGDGRILTALSRLTLPGQIFVRYESGNLLSARLGHSDASRDLALLLPRSGRFVDGVKASRGVPPPNASLTAFTLEKNRTVTPTEQTLAALPHASGRTLWKLAREPKVNELGGPVIDERGAAVGILVSGCLPTAPAPCSVPGVALPVTEVRSFLRELPASASFPVPRLGVRGVSVDGRVRGLRITEVEANSPASGLKLRASRDAEADILVAIAGTPVPSETALSRALIRHSPGERVELLIFGQGGYRTLNAYLGEPPLPPPAKAAGVSPPAPASQKPVPSGGGKP